MSTYYDEFEYYNPNTSIVTMQSESNFDESKNLKRKIELDSNKNDISNKKQKIDTINDYNQSQFTDICIKIDNDNYYMTKHQLSQMSGYFLNYFEDRPNDTIIDLSGIENSIEFKDLLDTFALQKRKKINIDNWWYLFKLSNKYDFQYIYTRCKNFIRLNKYIVLSNEEIEYVINIGDVEFAEFACKRLIESDSEIHCESIKNDRMKLYIIKYLNAKRRDYKEMIVNIITTVKKSYIDSNIRAELKDVLKTESIDISL